MVSALCSLLCFDTDGCKKKTISLMLEVLLQNSEAGAKGNRITQVHLEPGIMAIKWK